MIYIKYSSPDVSLNLAAEYYFASEHTFDEGVLTVEPTETTAGELKQTCSVCGKVTVAQQAIAKLTLSKVEGLNAKKIKVANLLPAIIFAVIAAFLPI